MRAFAGSLLDTALQRDLEAVGAALVASSGEALRRVPEGTLHLTYAFVASLPDAQLNTARQALAAVAAATPPVSLTLGAPEVLYGGREARLVLLPLVDGAASLALLARAVSTALAAALPDVAIRPTPAPHVTLARFRRNTPRHAARPVEATAAALHGQLRRHLTIDAVQLFESQLTPHGPRYLVRHELPLCRA